MKLYAIYDLETGDILQTHFEVDESEQSKELTEDEVLRMLPPDVDKNKVGVVALDRMPPSSTKLRVDPKTRTLSTGA